MQRVSPEKKNPAQAIGKKKKLKIPCPHPPSLFKWCVPYSQNWAPGTSRHYHDSSDCFVYPKKSLFKSGYAKKFLPNFPTPKKSRNRKYQPPMKKSFAHPHHLKSRVPPWGRRLTLCLLNFHISRFFFWEGGGGEYTSNRTNRIEKNVIIVEDFFLKET